MISQPAALASAAVKLARLIVVQSKPAAVNAETLNPASFSDAGSYPASTALLGSQPAALNSATVNPAVFTSAQLHPAAAQAAASNPAAFSDVASSPFTAALPSAARTAFTADKFCMPDKSRVRATADAMSCSGKEVPALAA